MSEEQTRFKGKRLSRKVIPIFISIVILVFTGIFIYKFGINSQNPVQIKREQEEKKKQEESIIGSTKITPQKAESELDDKENKYRQERRKQLEELAAKAQASDPVNEENSDGKEVVTEEIKKYESKKIDMYRKSTSKGLVAYEDSDDLIPGLSGRIPESVDRLSNEGIQEITKPANDVVNDSDDENSKFETASKAKANELIDSKARVLELAKSPYTILESTVVKGEIVNAVNTQLPGDLIVRVTEDVYDSINSEYLLIPSGTTLKGKYNSSVSEGQNRVFMSFNRMIFPSGASVKLDAETASDGEGRGGVEGKVLTEFWQSLGSSLMIATVGSIADRQRSQSQTINNYGGNMGVNTTAGTILAEAARANIAKFAKYRPKITLDAGTRISVIVAKDMVLDPSKVTRGR